MAAFKRLSVYELEAQGGSAAQPGVLRPCANAAREAALCGRYTHVAPTTFDPAAGAAGTSTSTSTSGGGSCGGGEPVASLVLDYSPIVTLAGAVPAPALRHVFFCAFKPGAPVEKLIAGYSGEPHHHRHHPDSLLLPGAAPRGAAR